MRRVFGVQVNRLATPERGREGRDAIRVRTMTGARAGLRNRLLENRRLLSSHVVGPADTVSDALRLLNVERVDGAILDTLLRREAPTLVAERLSDKGVPFVFHADVRLPDALWARFPLTPVCLKSMDAVALVGALSDYLGRMLSSANGEDRWLAEGGPAS